MSDLEKLEGEIRLLATKVIYAGFESGADPIDRERLEQLSEELIRLNAISIARAEDPVAA